MNHVDMDETGMYVVHGQVEICQYKPGQYGNIAYMNMTTEAPPVKIRPRTRFIHWELALWQGLGNCLPRTMARSSRNFRAAGKTSNQINFRLLHLRAFYGYLTRPSWLR